MTLPQKFILLTGTTAAHTSIFIVSTVSSVCVMSAVGQSRFCANTGKVVQVDGASPRPKEGITQSSVVCWSEGSQWQTTASVY